MRCRPAAVLRASQSRAPYLHGGRDTPDVVASDRQPEVERLYRTEVGWLWRAVMAYCGDREIANDAVAEAFTQVLTRGGAELRCRGCGGAPSASLQAS